MDVGEKIKIALEAKGMSQKELSEKAHATEASISRYINGERYPKWQIVKRIADVLDVSLDWLADRKESE
jgi:transcriptional regulator with XRE-family HTH domain